MPLPKPNPGGAMTGFVAQDLGLGGMLQDQVAGETEEQRKKRMQELQDRQRMGPAGSPATLALFGGMGGLTV